MAVTLSTALRQFMMDTGVNSAFDTTGILELHDGTRPSTADTTASGTNTLVSITLPSNVWLDPSTGGTTSKNGTWSSASAALSGTTTWGRFKLSTDSGTTGTTDRRLDFNVGTSGADCNLTTTGIIAGSPVTVNTATLTTPAQ